MNAVTALVLAGGRARRMGGIDKTELYVEGRTIFERQVAVLRDRVEEIVVSSPRAIAGYRNVVDPIEQGGPVAGIAAGLAAARTPWLLVVAGDMPHLSGALIDRMIERARLSDAAAIEGGATIGSVGRAIDAVGLRVAGLPEPLCALYRVATCRMVVDERVARRELKASRLLTDAGLAVSWIEEAELRQIDPTLKMLANINEPADL